MSEAGDSGTPTRRERFRDYIARMSAAAEPVRVIEQNLYVHRPSGLADQLTARLEIDPASRHLVVGGVGSGKTTELLVVRNRLNEHEDVEAVLVDVSETFKLARLRPGCLVILAARTFQGLEEWNFEALIYDINTNDPHRWTSSVPADEWSEISSLLVEQLREAHHRMRESGSHLVMLFDGLDRATDHEAFSKLVEQDVAALHWCGIGVVLVGPIRSLEGFGRLDVERFERLYTQRPIDVDQDAAGHDFLLKVLRARASVEMLSDEVADILVRFSGGGLRDLISLAKAAGDEAYMGGTDRIEVRDATVAADGFGRSLMVGLTPDEIETLKRLHAGQGFVRTTERDLALIATRRILEYSGNTPRYAVHPTIAPLLGQVGDKA
jgi:hypothetical protein